MGIIGRMFPSMSSDKVTVRIPDELPVLMKKVILEVLRKQPGDSEHEILSFIADYLDRLLEERRKNSEDLMDMVTNLTKTDEAKYIDSLKETNKYTDEQLDKLAITIQRKWRKYKGYDRGDFAAKDIPTNDNDISKGIFKTLIGDDISFNIANKAAAIIQKFWSKFRPFDSSKRLKNEDMEELNFECISEDDMERVNVVKKGQRDYVPPIPNLNDSFENLSVTDVYDNVMEISEGEEINND
uniref:RIIa domain-containing protein n=1 Tax=Sipha flava TaxID=143950 RepID=A0A2S2Q3R4_9HEMI